jgi:hypothetical protein
VVLDHELKSESAVYRALQSSFVTYKSTPPKPPGRFDVKKSVCRGWLPLPAFPLVDVALLAAPTFVANCPWLRPSRCRRRCCRSELPEIRPRTERRGEAPVVRCSPQCPHMHVELVGQDLKRHPTVRWPFRLGSVRGERQPLARAVGRHPKCGMFRERRPSAVAHSAWERPSRVRISLRAACHAETDRLGTSSTDLDGSPTSRLTE